MFSFCCCWLLWLLVTDSTNDVISIFSVVHQIPIYVLKAQSYLLSRFKKYFHNLCEWWYGTGQMSFQLNIQFIFYDKRCVFMFALRTELHWRKWEKHTIQLTNRNDGCKKVSVNTRIIHSKAISSSFEEKNVSKFELVTVILWSFLWNNRLDYILIFSCQSSSYQCKFIFNSSHSIW